MSIEFKKVDFIIPPPPTGQEEFDFNLVSFYGGRVTGNSNVSWSTVRDATDGNSGVSFYNHFIEGSYDDGTTPPQYWVTRSFLDFDLSGVPADAVITSGTLRCHPSDYLTATTFYGAEAVVQESAHGTGKGGALVAADFDAFSGPALSTTLIADDYTPHYFEFNQDGLDYLNANTGSTIKFCIREKAHDYDNSAPVDTNEQDFYNYNPALEDGVSHAEYKPNLTLHFYIPWEYTPPTTSQSLVSVAALGGTTGTNYHHDLRIANLGAQGGSWSAARDAVNANYANNYGDQSTIYVLAQESGKGGTWYVRRPLLAFDLGQIQSDYTIDSATLRITSKGFYNSEGKGTFVNAVLQQGTWDYIITTSGINDFTGPSLTASAVQWPSSGNTDFVLNQDGLDYLNANIGKVVYFMLREYDHDFLNVAPNLQQYYGSFYGTGQGFDPSLRVTVSSTD